MRRTKARRGLSGFLAVLMAISVLSSGLTAVVSAKDWGDPTNWAVPRTIAQAPKVEFIVPDRIMVADANGYTYGTGVVPQDYIIKFSLTDPVGQGLAIVANSVKISYSNISNDHLLDLKIRQHPTVAGVYHFGFGEGGVATMGDTIKLTVSYKTQDNGGTQRSWSTSSYCTVDNKRGEAFVAYMVKKAGMSGTAEHWTDSVLFMDGSLGTLSTRPGMQKMTGGSNAEAAFSYGFLSPMLRTSGDSTGFHEFCSIWGMPNVDGINYDRLISGDALFPGYLFRVKEEWAVDPWTLGSTNSDNEDLPQLRGLMDNFIPVAHYYYDVAPSFTGNKPIKITGFSKGKSGGDANCNEHTINRLSGGATLPGTFALSGGNEGSATLTLGGDRTIGTTTTWRVSRRHQYEYTNFWQQKKKITYYEKIDVAVHFYDKQYLRKVVQDIQALNLQESWMLDAERGSYDDELKLLNQAGTANQYYIPYHEFEAAYARAVAILNRSDVPTASGDSADMQREIDLATANLLSNIQSTEGDPFKIATPTGFAARYQASTGSVFQRGQAKLVLKPAEYGGVDIYMLNKDFPDEYWLPSTVNYKYFEDNDFELLDKAVQDVLLDRPLDLRYQAVVAQQRANLKDALYPDGQLIKYRRYKATFESWNGAIWDEKQVRVYDEILQPATNPTRNQYIFDGWEKQVGPDQWERVRFDLAPQIMGIEDVHYRAIWVANALVGYFDTSPSTYTIDPILAYCPGGQLYPPTVDLNDKLYGYTFGGWVDAVTGEPAFTAAEPYLVATERGERHFRAVWKPVANDVVFWRMQNGQEEWIRVADQLYDTNILKPDGVPVRQGYSFLGWANEPGGALIDWSQPVKMTVGHRGPANEKLVKSFYPVYSNTGPYTLAFYSDIPSGSNFMKYNKIFRPDDLLIYLDATTPAKDALMPGDTFNNLPSTYWPTKAGAQFTGRWLYLDENTCTLQPFTGFDGSGPFSGGANNLAKMPSHNLYLFPEFTGEERRLVFHANNGPVTGFQEPLRILGKPAGEAFEIGDIPTPSADNYRFLGWFYADGTTKFLAEEMPFTAQEEIHLYAHWQVLRQDNVSIKMTPNQTATPGTENGATLLPGDWIKLDVSLRSSFAVHGNYTVIYYDKTYFEPCWPEMNMPYIEKIQGGSQSSGGGILEFITVNPANGLWNLGNVEGDVNVQPPIDYPAQWKDANNQLLPQYQNYGAIAVKVPYDFTTNPGGVAFANDTAWFSFYLRVKDSQSIDNEGVPHPAPATPEGKTADIFFSELACRDFVAGRRNSPMYYCAAPPSDSYETVEILTTPPLQYIIENIQDPISVTFVTDAAKGIAVDSHGQEVSAIRFEKGMTIGGLKAADKWPEILEELQWRFVGWVTEDDYALYQDSPVDLLARVLPDTHAFIESKTLYAVYTQAKQHIRVEYRLENLPGSAEPYDGSNYWEGDVIRGTTFSVNPGDAWYRAPDFFPGYTYKPEASRLAVDGAVMKDEVLWLYYARQYITFRFDMDGTNNGIIWEPVTEAYNTDANAAFYNSLIAGGVPSKVGYTFDATRIVVKADGTARPTKFLTDTTLKPAWLPKQVNLKFIVTNGKYPESGPAYWVVGYEDGIEVNVGDDFKDLIPKYPEDYTVSVPAGYKHLKVDVKNTIVPATDDAEVLIEVGKVTLDGRPVTRYLVVPGVTDPMAFPGGGILVPAGNEVLIPTKAELIAMFGQDIPEIVRDLGKIDRINLVSGALEVPTVYDENKVPPQQQGVVVPAGSKSTPVEVYIYMTIPDYFYLNYNANGGTWKGTAPSPAYYAFVLNQLIDKTELLANPTATPILTRAGYQFVGWSLNAAARQADGSVQMMSAYRNTTQQLYAVWVPEVTYVPGAELTIPSATEAFPNYYGAQMSIPQTALPKEGDAGVTASKAGCVLVGWATTEQAAPSKTATQPGAIAYTAPVTLYPVWKIKTYTIAFDNTGVNIGSNVPPITNVGWGEDVSIPATEPLANGKEFLGWTDVQGGNTVKYSAPGTITAFQPSAADGATITLYPVWETLYYTLLFELGSDPLILGTPPYQMQNLTYGMEYAQSALPNPIITEGWDLHKDGYVFSHWAATENGAKVDPIVITGDMTLYPVFVPEYQEVYLTNTLDRGTDVIVDDDLHYVYGFPANTTPTVMFGTDYANVGGLVHVVGDGRIVDITNGSIIGTGYTIHLSNNTLPTGHPNKLTTYYFVLFGDTGDGKINQTDVTYCESVLGSIPTQMTPKIFAMTFLNASDFYAPATVQAREAIRSGNIAQASAATRRRAVVRAWAVSQGG